MMLQKKYVNGRQLMGGIPRSDLFTHIRGGENTEKLKSASGKTFGWYFLPLLLAILVHLWIPVAEAADVKLIPRLAAGGAYDDNIFLSADDKVSSSIFTVSPSIELDYQTLLSNLRLKADWDILSYFDESDLNRTNQYYRLSGDHRIKERWDTSAEFKYYNDTTLNTYLQETGRVIDRVQRDFFEAGGRVAYNLTMVSGISAEYRYQTASYEDDVYSDYDNHRVNLYYFQRLKSEVDRLSFGPSYYHRTNDQNEVDSFSLDIGWDRDWSSITRSGAAIGARYTEVMRNNGTKDDNWGAKARFELTSEGTVSTTIFRYFHDLRTTNAGDDVNVDNFFLNYRLRITERFGAGINGRLVFSYKLLNQDSDINDERYYWVEPRLYYQLTEHLDLSLRYRYQNNVEFGNDGEQDITRERNIVWLQLSYGFPMLL
jgi:hypothetical protein